MPKFTLALGFEGLTSYAATLLYLCLNSEVSILYGGVYTTHLMKPVVVRADKCSYDDDNILMHSDTCVLRPSFILSVYERILSKPGQVGRHKYTNIIEKKVD